MEKEPVPARRQHLWPWFVLGVVLMGMLLAMLWLSAEVRRTRERRQYYIPRGETNVSSPTR